MERLCQDCREVFVEESPTAKEIHCGCVAVIAVSVNVDRDDVDDGRVGHSRFTGVRDEAYAERRDAAFASVAGFSRAPRGMIRRED